MSSVVEFTRDLVRGEQARGLSLRAAFRAAARAARLAPGTVENAFYGRLKRDEHIKESICAALERQLRRQIAETEAQLALVRARAPDADPSRLRQIQAALKTARDLLEDGRGNDAEDDGGMAGGAD